MGWFQPLHLSQSLAPGPWQVRHEAWQGWQRHPLASPNMSWGHSFTQAPSGNKEKEHPNIDPLKKQYYKAITHSELMVFQLSFLSFILMHDYVFIVLIHLINPDSHGFISLILSNTYDFFHLCAEFYITFIAWFRVPLHCYTFTALNHDFTLCILLVCIQL